MVLPVPAESWRILGEKAKGMLKTMPSFAKNVERVSEEMNKVERIMKTLQSYSPSLKKAEELDREISKRCQAEFLADADLKPAAKPPARAGMPSKKLLKPPPLSAKKRPAETEPAKTNKKIIKSDEFMKLTKALQRHSYDAIKLEAEHQKTWQSLFDDIEGMKRNSMNQATRMLVYNVFLVASRKYWPSKDWNAIGVAMALGTQPATKAKSTYKALQTETANDFQFYIQKLAMNAPP